MLNRPIIFYIPDFKRYYIERGFLLEPYERWTPGPKVRDLQEFMMEIEDTIFNAKKWEKERLWLRDVMFKHIDGNSSKRVKDFIFELMDEF